MKILKSGFSVLQKVGKALMLPVSVLPVAGLLLGIGSAKFSWMPIFVSNIMAQAGGVIFGNLPIMFAIGVALGLAGNDGVAALAAVVGYVVLLATLGVVAAASEIPTTSIMGIASIDTGVFGGILVGIIAAFVFSRFYKIKLPAYLGFFAGKRSVPILTAVAAVFTGFVLSIVWPPIGSAIATFSHWAATENPAVAFSIYGFVERLLIPFGLHHIWNVPFFFEVGQYLDVSTGKNVVGEVARYISGDPTAGNMAGGYLFKMWGLPAAAMAIWYNAKKENKNKILGIMVSAALTSFLTGITEPIEFSFLFLAPLLYLVHAVLSGLAFFVCIALGIKHGMTFSHGLIDYVVLFPQSTKALWIFLVGPMWAMMYFWIFTYAIRKFDLKTPGRELEQSDLATGGVKTQGEPREQIRQLIHAFGGAMNIVDLDACITRLRVKVKNPKLVNEIIFKNLGAAGSVIVGESVQVIFGTQSENMKTEMERHLDPSVQDSAESETTSQKLEEIHQSWYLLFGGQDKVKSLELCATNRVRVELNEGGTAVIQAPLNSKWVKISERVGHLIFSPTMKFSLNQKI